MRLWPTKRWWKRILIGGVIVVGIVLIVNVLIAWSVDARWRARVAVIRAAGDPASIADLAPAPVPAGGNAAVKLQRLEARLREFSLVQGKIEDDSPLGKAYMERSWRGEPPTAEQVEMIRSTLRPFSDLDASLAEAAACNEYASVVDYRATSDQLFEAIGDTKGQLLRGCGRYLDWRQQLSQADGKYEDAAEQGLQLLRLTRIAEHEPTFSSMFIANAVRGVAVYGISTSLPEGPVSDRVHTALDTELARFEDPSRMMWALRSERAYWMDAYENPSDFLPSAPAWLRGMVLWTKKRERFAMLDVVEAELAAVARPLHVKVAESESFFSESNYHGSVAEMMKQQIGMTYTIEASTAVSMRALRILNALTLYRQQHGREATGLAELSLPKEATIDPFDGKSLKLKHTNEGWIVYSVGLDGVDDGGDFRQRKDFGVAPPRVRALESQGEASDTKDAPAEKVQNEAATPSAS